MARTRAITAARATIVLPSSVTRQAKFACLICSKPFFEGEELAYERHVVACSEENIEELRAQLPSERLPGIYGPDREAAELERWVDKHRQEIREGRKKM